MAPVETATWIDTALRIGAAILAGAVIGINRDLHRKSIGLRTLGLVSLGSCMLVLTVTQFALRHGANGSDAASRVAQGLVSGIGFLGAGVILRGPDQIQVHGLTTAAAILVVAALGVSCALAAWPVLAVGFAGTMLLLIVCGPIETAIQRAMDRHQGLDRDDDLPPGRK
jgi:putative Mg2+ transporter-C (MgtC) family protein